MHALKTLLAAAAVLLPSLASAASLNGAELSITWAIPFAGILLSIALIPLIAPDLWHHHYGKIAVAWGLSCVIPIFMAYPSDVAVGAVAHAMIGDYVPFIFFVGALMGTTGAAMLLIRPLLAANENRRYKMHTFIFFIFIVANIGGCLTPLGDPPLFLGFLRGVTFFWTAAHLILPLLVTLAILLAIYLAIDTYFYRKEVAEGTFDPNAMAGTKFGIDGGINFLYLAMLVGAVLMSGMWNSGIEVNVLGVHLTAQGLARDAIFIVVAILSLLTTSKAAREANQFSWEPIKEVAKLFFGIFLCIVPVLEMLRAGHEGAFAPLVALVTNEAGEFNNVMFFWLTGSLSAFLDNAPTYLAFFNLAGGDPVELMTTHAHTLMAVSMGAVFMGAVTYIGNAPNLMSVSIVRERGVKMPSFFGYMLWSVGILFPTFFIVDIIFL